MNTDDNLKELIEFLDSNLGLNVIKAYRGELTTDVLKILSKDEVSIVLNLLALNRILNNHS
jgi:hypothetical protein